jgi:hypothetical protein
MEKQQIDELLLWLPERGCDQLRIISRRVGEIDWRRSRGENIIDLTEASTVTTPAWLRVKEFHPNLAQLRQYIRVVDLSEVTMELMPDGEKFICLRELETVIMPSGLRVLPRNMFRGCWRLSSVDTSRTSLERMEPGVCGDCVALTHFSFPSTVRYIGDLCIPDGEAFIGSAIAKMDLSDTLLEHVSICEMAFLEELILPRRCVLVALCEVPCLRRVTFGVAVPRESVLRSHVHPWRDPERFTWLPTEVRFEGMIARPEFSPGLEDARVYGEVAAQMGHETLPFPPP